MMMSISLNFNLGLRWTIWIIPHMAQHFPVKHVVIFESFMDEQVTEQFSVPDLVILRLLGSGFYALPWEMTTKEIYEDVRKRLEIISTGLLYAQMSVDRRISGSASETLALLVGDMDKGPRVMVSFRKAEIDNIHLVHLVRADAYQKVVWFDVAMNEVLRVGEFNTRNLTIVRTKRNL